MLTVNVKYGYTEKVFEALQVVACLDENRPIEPQFCGDYDYLEVSTPDGQLEIVLQGQVFVMNSDGKTIAKYLLLSRELVADSVPGPGPNRNLHAGQPAS